MGKALRGQHDRADYDDAGFRAPSERRGTGRKVINDLQRMGSLTEMKNNERHRLSHAAKPRSMPLCAGILPTICAQHGIAALTSIPAG